MHEGQNKVWLGRKVEARRRGGMMDGWMDGGSDEGDG